MLQNFSFRDQMTVDTLYIHIGTHKAGSTALQAFIQINRTRFARNGILIPSSGFEPEDGHHSNLVWSDLRADLFTPDHGTLADLVDELGSSSQPRALISSEEFELLPDRTAVARLFAQLTSVVRKIVLIVYFRPQFDYASSAYFEALESRQYRLLP